MTLQVELQALRDRPLFICGHPKAGTSLVRAVFDSHPQLIVYPEETVFFRRYLPQASGLDQEGQLELAERTLIHIFRWNRAQPTADQDGFPDRDYSAIAYEEVRSRMRANAAQDYRYPGDILSAAVLAFGEVSGQASNKTSRWVEKSPYNEYFAQTIFDWWPEARCIHILRDPRDNYVSYRRKHPDWSPEFFASNWNRSTQAGMENQARFGSQRYFILRYEDLARSPEETLQKLSAFLQIEWDAALFSPTRAGEQWQGNSMFANQFQGISTLPVARWKEQLSPVEALIIELKTRQLRQAWGYEDVPLAQPGQTGPAHRLVARWRLAIWPLRRKLQRLMKGRAQPPSE